jgi:hypothetical protein
MPECGRSGGRCDINTAHSIVARRMDADPTVLGFFVHQNEIDDRVTLANWVVLLPRAVFHLGHLDVFAK